jgi:AAA15 family ATPase/GTPase
MRINELEIKDFKVFYGSCLIDLHTAGQNLLVYGEIGTGKSSLALALKLFLEAGVKHHEFAHYKNVFVEDNSGCWRRSKRAEYGGGGSVPT